MKQNEVWSKIREIAECLRSPHEDKIFVAKDYTKKQLREDLLAAIPEAEKTSNG